MSTPRVEKVMNLTRVSYLLLNGNHIEVRKKKRGNMAMKFQVIFFVFALFQLANGE